MTQPELVSKLINKKDSICGKDIPQESRVEVIDDLKEYISDKDKKIEKLTQQLLWLQRQVYGHKSEKSHPDDPSQLQIEFEGMTTVNASPTPEEIGRIEQTAKEVIEDLGREAEKRRQEKKKAASRKDCTYRIPDNIRRIGDKEEDIIYPEGYSEETMVVIGYDTTETLERTPEEFYVKVSRRAICKPRDSKPTDLSIPISEAPAPQNCLPGCIAGNSLMAGIITDKFCHHIPEYRQVKRCESTGITLSTTSINRWIHDLASQMMPMQKLQMELVLSSIYHHWDESTIPIGDVKHKTRKGYIWAVLDGLYRYGLVFFYIKGSRSSDIPQTILLQRNTAVQSDGFIAYEKLENLEGITTLCCMAHARRKFEAIRKFTPEAEDILQYIAALYTLEANLKYKKATPEEIYKERQDKAVPILNAIKLKLDQYVKVDTPESALAKACNYSLERWRELCRYCEDGRYEIDNNAVERSIRPLTLGRKNWLFVNSDDSAQDTALWLTLVGSCNLLGIAPYRYFMYVLPRIKKTMTDDDWRKLLPYRVAEVLKAEKNF